MCAARRECNQQQQQQQHHQDYAAHFVLIMARRLNTLRDGPSHLISRPVTRHRVKQTQGRICGRNRAAGIFVRPEGLEPQPSDPYV